jgi:hypothetical protein
VIVPVALIRFSVGDCAFGAAGENGCARGERDLCGGEQRQGK